MKRKVGGYCLIQLCVCLFMACVGVGVIVSVSTICMQGRHGSLCHFQLLDKAKELL